MNKRTEVDITADTEEDTVNTDDVSDNGDAAYYNDLTVVEEAESEEMENTEEASADMSVADPESQEITPIQELSESDLSDDDIEVLF
jgi:hypothetical protein